MNVGGNSLSLPTELQNEKCRIVWCLHPVYQQVYQLQQLTDSFRMILTSRSGWSCFKRSARSFSFRVSFYVKLESKKWSPWYSFAKDHARTLRDPACKKGLLQDFIASFLLGLSFFTKSNINKMSRSIIYVPVMTSWVLSLPYLV